MEFMSKANEVACRSAPALAGAKGTRKRNTNEKARGKAEKPQKGKKHENNYCRLDKKESI